MARASGFQPDDEGSIPSMRSIYNKLTCDRAIERSSLQNYTMLGELPRHVSILEREHKMKTILIILFLILSTVGFSMDSKTQDYLLNHYVNISRNLAYGVEHPTASMKFNDFSNIYKPTTSFLSVPAKSTEELIPFSVNE